MTAPVSRSAGRTRGRSAGVLAVLLALGAVACTSKNPPPGPCPRALILSDADSLTRFREGTGRDLIDIDFGGRIANVTSECDYDVDKSKAGTMTVRVTPAFAVERGPANRDRKAALSYFVTLVDAKREPIAKSVFGIAAAFPANVTRQVLADTPIELKVPIRAGQSGRDFAVYVGFQLSEADLEYNRRLKREREGLR